MVKGINLPDEVWAEIDELVKDKSARFASRSHAVERIFQEWKELRNVSPDPTLAEYEYIRGRKFEAANA